MLDIPLQYLRLTQLSSSSAHVYVKINISFVHGKKKRVEKHSHTCEHGQLFWVIHSHTDIQLFRLSGVWTTDILFFSMAYGRQAFFFFLGSLPLFYLLLACCCIGVVHMDHPDQTANADNEITWSHGRLLVTGNATAARSR